MKGIVVLITSCIIYACLSPSRVKGQPAHISITPVGQGWANNSINAVIFRKNSLTTWKNTQFIAYYNGDGQVVLGKRKAGSSAWQTRVTPFKGNAADAHNTISIIADGKGYLHLSWDHHNNALHYARSITPGSLEMEANLPMTGSNETRVSYPEFYRLKSGNLIFMYRNGESGQGNLIVNRYILETGKWEQIQTNLIDGEGARNAYCQTAVDGKGTIHISWVWRETPDVASNHDLCYARSEDEGITWKRSDGSAYTLPIKEATAEYALHIPQKSELINQTSMAADDKGRPYIATYWREPGSTVPQFHLVYFDGTSWKVNELKLRTSPFSLSGAGTKRIPISRPQVMVTGSGATTRVILVFRDDERGGKASLLSFRPDQQERLQIVDLTATSLGAWEPTYDTDLWNSKQVLDLFIQPVEQVDGEGKANVPPSMVSVLEWKDR